MDILQLVDRLEALVNKSRHIPLSAGIVVNEEAILELVDQLRIAVPEEVKAARRVQQERQRVLTEAQEEADRIVEQARGQISGLIDQDEYVQAARGRAGQLIAQAEEQAAAMRQGADDYVAQVLTQLDEQLAQAQRVVRNGLASVGGATPLHADGGR
jgi:hypothetical protein